MQNSSYFNDSIQIPFVNSALQDSMHFKTSSYTGKRGAHHVCIYTSSDNKITYLAETSCVFVTKPRVQHFKKGSKLLNN